jgi:hypothetical protein
MTYLLKTYNEQKMDLRWKSSISSAYPRSAGDGRPSWTGLSTERVAIFGWQTLGSGSCPLTCKPLTASDLCTDRRRAWVVCGGKMNGVPEQPMRVAAAEASGFLRCRTSTGKSQLHTRRSRWLLRPSEAFLLPLSSTSWRSRGLLVKKRNSVVT